MKTKMPKTIYVRRDGDVGSEYLVADQSTDSIEDDGTVVAIYELKGMARLSISRQLTSVPQRRKKAAGGAGT